jgi:hypothetical protein
MRMKDQNAIPDPSSNRYESTGPLVPENAGSDLRLSTLAHAEQGAAAAPDRSKPKIYQR